ncbi:glycosyltransferase [Gillisia sp. Q332]|uniref:glycosyltransferase n=1 Tax=Gillisia xinjiangensis TaxID=3384765 RepID=UPI00391A4E92
MTPVLVIGYVWPEPNSTAAGSRMMQLLEFFISEGFSVTFATTASESIHRANLESLNISIIPIKLNDSSFDVFLKDLQPQMVVFDRFMMEEQFGWRVHAICPDALKILDTEDLHFLRNFRELEFIGKNPLSTKESELAKREIASIYRCDLSLIISEVEKKLLNDDFNIPENLLLYLPFLIKKITSEEIAFLPKFEEREHFVSIGNFRHAPNADAIMHLKREIWPIIRKKLPDVQMHIYGAYPAAKITQLHDPKNGFLIQGWAKDAAEIVKKARISLAPLRFGAGLKGKLIEAMQCGTPNITTSVGAEGIPGSLDWNGFIEDSPEGFAACAVELYTSKTPWKQAQENGFKILDYRFSSAEFHNVFHNRLADLKKNLKQHRMENFTGAMLLHHRVKSTYYLSRYIEVKNELLNLKKSEEF